MSNQTYNFTLVLDPIEGSLDKIEDRLFESGCDDALFGTRSGTPYLDFSRQSSGLVEAILSAISDVERANLPTPIVRVEPDDIVNLSEIARRTSFSREYIRKLFEGIKGPGLFPRPISGLIRRSPLWRWVEIVQWLVEKGLVEQGKILVDAKFVVYLNQLLTSRRRDKSRDIIKWLEQQAESGRNQREDEMVLLALAIEKKLENTSIENLDK
jgi:hypothetical protein